MIEIPIDAIVEPYKFLILSFHIIVWAAAAFIIAGVMYFVFGE